MKGPIELSMLTPDAKLIPCAHGLIALELDLYHFLACHAVIELIF